MNGLLTLFRSMNRWALAAGLGAALGLGAPMIASAQDDAGVMGAERGRGHGRGHHGRGMRHRFGRMAEELGLTPAQQEQVRGVMSRAREERRALRDLPPEQRGPAMRQMRQRTRGQLEQILTPEQQTRARALRQQHGEQRMGRRLEHMRERLGLSPAQEARIRAIFERARAERQRIAAGTAAGQARHDALSALRTRTRDAMRNVLTPEQQARLGNGRGHGRGHERGRGHR